MSDDNIDFDLNEKLHQLYNIIQCQDKKIAELQTRLKSNDTGKNSTLKLFNLYIKFVRTIQDQGLVISRKYCTENSRNYVDVQYSIYRDFVSGHLEPGELRSFKEFLQHFRLAEPGVFDSSGLYVQTAGSGRTRVVRIRTDLVKWVAS